MVLLLIALGGAAGSVTRYVVDTWVSERVASAFPWGTFVINMSGSFLVGVLFALAIERNALPASIRPPLMIGFLGAYTTFSTLTLETWRLVEGGATWLAAANVLGSAALGVLAMVFGLAVGRVLA
ncbi:MAG TPA: CrcB family protein [Vitreimonas sp.]|nr:CrcB family protein [Vitreimonas sp.]